MLLHCFTFSRKNTFTWLTESHDHLLLSYVSFGCMFTCMYKYYFPSGLPFSQLFILHFFHFFMYVLSVVQMIKSSVSEQQTGCVSDCQTVIIRPEDVNIDHTSVCSQLHMSHVQPGLYRPHLRFTSNQELVEPSQEPLAPF